MALGATIALWAAIVTDCAGICGFCRRVSRSVPVQFLHAFERAVLNAGHSAQEIRQRRWKLLLNVPANTSDRTGPALLFR